MKNWVIETLSLLLFFALGIAAITAATSISGISFDPLGSKTVPYVVGSLTILLCLLYVWQLIRRHLLGATKSIAPESTDHGDRVYSGGEMIELGIVTALVLAYSVALFEFRLPFSVMTMCLIPAVAAILERRIRGPVLLVAIGLGAFLGFGGELLFTKVFFIDLPTLW